MADIELTITVDEGAARWFVENYTPARSGYITDRVAESIAAALPKPRPAEPMGLGAVVRDGKGRVWMQTRDPSYPWRSHVDGRSHFSDYAELPNPIEVLSEGVIL